LVSLFLIHSKILDSNFVATASQALKISSIPSNCNGVAFSVDGKLSCDPGSFLQRSDSKSDYSTPFVGSSLSFAKSKSPYSKSSMTLDSSNYLKLFNQYRIGLIQSSVSSDISFQTLVPAEYFQPNTTAPNFTRTSLKYSSPLFTLLSGNLKDIVNQAQLNIGSRRKPTSPGCASLAASGVEVADLNDLVNSWKQMYPDAGLDISRLAVSDAGINAQYTIVLYPSLNQKQPFQSLVSVSDYLLFSFI
jgi:hypothetical protein